MTPEGVPLFGRDPQGRPVGLWIKLTVLGVTRLGYGSVDGPKADAVKELIGDAIRNAAMRFGVALDLWAKSELESQLEEAGPAPAPGPSQPVVKTAAPPPQEESGGPVHGPESSGSSSSWETIAAAVSNTSRSNRITKNRVLSVTVPVLLQRDAMPEKELRYDHIANLGEDVLQEVVKRLGLNQQEMASK